MQSFASLSSFKAFSVDVSSPSSSSSRSSRASSHFVSSRCSRSSSFALYCRRVTTDVQRTFQASNTNAARREREEEGSEETPIAESTIKAPLVPNVAGSQDEDVESCAFVLISIDNDSFDDRSVLKLQIQSLPGLMRIISWLLEGLDLEIVNAKIATDEDLFVTMEFEIVEKTYDDEYVKLSDPDGVKERLEDYLNFCISKTNKEMEFGVKRHRGVCVDNESSRETTIATVVVNTSPVKSLLPISSAVTALKLKIDSAELVNLTTMSKEVAYRANKMWRFELVTAGEGEKLTNAEANALFYTLTLLVQSATKGSGKATFNSTAAARDIATPMLS